MFTLSDTIIPHLGKWRLLKLWCHLWLSFFPLLISNLSANPMALHLQESSQLSSPPVTTGHRNLHSSPDESLSPTFALHLSVDHTAATVIPLSKPNEVCLLPKHHPISDIFKLRDLVLSSLLRRSELSCHHATSHSFRPSYRVLFAVYQTGQIQLCHRAFAHIILSAWNALPSGIHKTNLSLNSERPSN